MGTPRMEDLQQKKTGQIYEGIEYQEFWGSDARKSLHQLERILIQELLPTTGKRILDLGCGYGRLVDCYADKFDQVVLLDGSYSLLQEARKKNLENAVYITADINALPFSTAYFDCVLIIRVFHHLDDSVSLFHSIGNSLINQGVLVFNYSNKINPGFIKRWANGKLKGNPFSLEPGGIGSTFIQHHPRYVARLLEEYGFSDVIYRGAGVTDKFPGLLRRSKFTQNMGVFISPILGNLKIAPWMMCKARIESDAQFDPDDDITDILVCPSCKQSLSAHTDAYYCKCCNVKYPISDGIIDLRIP